MVRRSDRQRGLTLTELMVSVAISIAVLVALSNVYLGSRAAYRTNEALARVQEAGRVALDSIARDLRAAGDMGCLSRGAQVTVYSNPRPAGLASTGAIHGYEGAVGFSYPKGIERLSGDGQSDVMRILAIDAIARADIVGESDVAAASITLADNRAGFEPNDVLLASDCERAAIFTVTGVQSNPVRLLHGDAGNGGLDTPAHRISPPFKAQSRAFVARLGSATYFIGRSREIRNAPPSLYRADLDRTERVAENVEDLDFLYGLDDDGDGAVDRYLRADQIGGGRWNDVLSVRVGLVVVSAEAAVPGGGQVVRLRDIDGDTVLDAQPAAGDRRLRQVFTTTVSLRNRLQ